MLKARFTTPSLAYWHDMGHGQVRENLGWIRHREWAERLLPNTCGVHIHDVKPLVRDHLAPLQGQLPFADFACYGTAPVLRVFEPSPNIKSADLVAGLNHLRKIWTV